MKKLTVTLIDVGWGDSILLESETTQGKKYYGLIDSNDSANSKSSYIFIKRQLEKDGVDIAASKPIFEFIILTHAHADHGQGLKWLMKTFGTKNFWYPKSLSLSSLAELIRYANRSSSVQWHQAVDQARVLPDFGPAKLKVLWPAEDVIEDDENNNSIVLEAKLGQISFLLTGDAEAEVWDRINNKIPNKTGFFKVPHHGSVNGTFKGSQPAWLDHCPASAKLGISAHIKPFSHPHQAVIDLFKKHRREYYRTDVQYHLVASTDGAEVTMQYSH